MAIELDYTPQLEQKQIFKFVTGNDLFFEDSVSLLDYDFVVNREAGNEDLSFYCSSQEFYNILQHNRIINSFSVIVPIEQKVKLTIKSNLFIHKSVADNTVRQTIIDAFNRYNSLVDGSIDSYVFKTLTAHPELSSDMVSILQSFRIDKIGNLIEHRNQANTILSQYNDIRLTGKITAKANSLIISGTNTLFKTELAVGNIIGYGNYNTIGVVEKIISDTELYLKKEPYKDEINTDFEIVGIESEFHMITIEGKGILLSQYFRDREIRAVLTHKQFIEELPTSKKEDVHFVDGTDEEELKKVLDYETKGLDCPDLKEHRIKIVRIPTLPDFRTEIVWRIREFCGIKTKLPWFEKSQVRYVYQTLFACVAYRNHIDSYILNSIKSAAENAARDAAVIGIWLGSFEVALSTFKALFQKNIENLIEKEKECITAYLAVLQEKGEWEDL